MQFLLMLQQYSKRSVDVTRLYHDVYPKIKTADRQV